MKNLYLFALTLLATFLTEKASALIEITQVHCICATGKIEVTAEPDPGKASAGPFTFEWSGPGGYTSSLEDPDDIIIPGTYTVTVTNAYGCATVLTTDVEKCFTVEPVSVTCVCPNTFGALSVEVTGGNAPYAYHWQGPSGYQSYEQSPDDISIPGEYTVVVTDFTGCEAETVINVETCQTSTVVTPVLVNCICPGGYGSIEIEVDGNDGPYHFVWFAPNGLDIYTVQNPAMLTEPGDYSLVVTGSSGCTSEFTVNVPACDFTFSNFLVQINNSCNGPGTGSVEVTIPAGVGSGPYLFQWTDTNGVPLQQVSAGDYSAVAEGLPSG